MTILVTGGTGKVGRRLVRRLRQAGVGVRIASPHPEGADTIAFDWSVAATWDAAINGVGAAYLIPPPTGGDASSIMIDFIERAVVLSPESVLRLALTEMKQMTKAEPAVAACTLADAEREHILGVLKQTGGMIGGEAGAATRLGLPRTTLIYKMRKLGIEVRRANRSRPLQKTDGGESALFACAAAGGFRTDGLEAFA